MPDTLSKLEGLRKKREQLEHQIAVAQAGVQVSEKREKELLAKCKEFGIDITSNPQGVIELEIQRLQGEIDAGIMKAQALENKIGELVCEQDADKAPAKPNDGWK
jgi:hypothetical protein